jgi:hypothetical protein
MIEWLNRAEASLKRALEVAERGDIPKQNLYMLASILYSQEFHTNDEALLQAMSEANEEQVARDCSIDDQSKLQYKFHYVSSYLYCFVVAGKIEEMKYDRIMDYVNDEMDLFTSD